MARLLPRGVLTGLCAIGALVTACSSQPTAPSPSGSGTSVTTQPNAPAPSTAATVALFDDFSGTSLDNVRWFVPTGAGTFLGRTQLRPTAAAFTFTGSSLRMPLDLYNPSALVAGDSFFGSEIVSQQVFTRGRGLVVHARVRLVAPLWPGVVASIFLYETRGGVRDEIDFELLTNEANTGRVLTNLFNDADFSSPGRPLLVTVPSLSLTGFNDFLIEWLPDRVRWTVNGVLVREETTALPDEPMALRFNIWAPAADFAQAFDASLQPTAVANDNQVLRYELDQVYVESR